MEFITFTTCRGKQAFSLGGYCYRQDKRTRDGRLLWRCMEETCCARRESEGFEDIPIPRGHAEHCHAPRREEGLQRSCISTMKDQATTTTGPIPQTYSTVAEGLHDMDALAASTLPAEASLSASLYCSRRAVYPPLPKTEQDFKVDIPAAFVNIGDYHQAWTSISPRTSSPLVPLTLTGGLQSAPLLKRQRGSSGGSGARQNPHRDDLKTSFIASVNRAVHTQQSAHMSSVNRLRHTLSCQSLSDKQWWTNMKKATGATRNSADVPLLVDSHGKEFHTSAEKAECLAKHFSSKCSLGDRELTINDLPAVTTPTHEPLEHVHFREASVRRHLARLVPSKASGPDSIPSRILKECPKELAAAITKLFRVSFRAGVVPSQWKLAHVVPVYKKPPRSRPSNYRPVSLLSILSKVMECIINQQVTNFLERNDLLPDSQFGFRRGRGTADLLTALQSECVRVEAEGGCVQVVAIDIAGAFYHVFHVGLLNKAERVGIGGPLLSWLRDYLSNSCLKVVCNWRPRFQEVPHHCRSAPRQRPGPHTLHIIVCCRYRPMPLAWSKAQLFRR
eukprot:scpid53825/ scgid29586/ Probable RNA-directed DNA polymerase from transposon X-element; Reverse transcriptase